MGKKRIWTVSRHGSPYRTAIRLWGYRWHRLRIHLFHRGDNDPAPHDHPNDFWTFPLRGYWEETFIPELGLRAQGYVKPFRWHFRQAEYVHRVLGHRKVAPGKFGGWFLTLVKEGPPRRSWGFWEWSYVKNCAVFIPWRKYLGEEG